MTWWDFISQASGAAFGLFCASMFWRWRTRRDAEWRRRALEGDAQRVDYVAARYREAAPLVALRAGAPDQFVSVPDEPVNFRGPLQSRAGNALLELQAAFVAKHGRTWLTSELPSYDELNAYLEGKR